MTENEEEQPKATTESDVESMKKSFNAKVNDTIEWKLCNNSYFGEEIYQRRKQHINDLKRGQRKKAQLNYQTLERYVFYDTFWLIGHGGRNRMIKELQSKL